MGKNIAGMYGKQVVDLICCFVAVSLQYFYGYKLKCEEMYHFVLEFTLRNFIKSCNYLFYATYTDSVSYYVREIWVIIYFLTLIDF